jgi:Dolichyl-phosphate-mannose-protein mannosyltransferase
MRSMILPHEGEVAAAAEPTRITIVTAGQELRPSERWGLPKFRMPVLMSGGWLTVACWLGFAVLYFSATWLISSHKLLWYDELFTVYVAQYQSTADLFSMLASFEPHPPLTSWLTRAAQTLAGTNPVAYRLPAMLGFFLLCVCVHQMARRWVAGPWAWLPVLVLLGSGSFYYATEARPYGLVLGGCGLAMLSWQTAIESQRRFWPLIGLALGLALSSSSHYYGILLLVPIGMGELVRVWQRRRIDWPIWLAMLLSVVPFALCLPLALEYQSQAVIQDDGSWQGTIQEAYGRLFAHLELPLFASLILLLALGRMSDPSSSVPAPIIIAVVALALLPLVGVAIKEAVSGVFVSRYTESAIVGFSLLILFAAHRLARGLALAGYVLLFVWLGWFLVRVPSEYHRMVKGKANLNSAIAFLRTVEAADHPVVITDKLLYCQLHYYGPADVKETAIYLSSPVEALRVYGDNSAEHECQALARRTDLRLADFDAFLRDRQTFYIYGDGRWLLPALQSRGSNIRLVRSHGKTPLYFVDCR